MDSRELVERDTILRATSARPSTASTTAARTTAGERSFEKTITEIDEVEHRLAEALERTSLPPEPDRAAVDRYLVDAYRRAWAW